jgi:membrane protein implicated in regulation of membrane protease activity
VDFPLGPVHLFGYRPSMPTSADALRRWLGLCFLALAFGLLVWGQTVLRDKLKGMPFLLYWMVCFLFTMAAVVTALLDLRATRRRARQEHEELIQRTLNEIESETPQKPGE